MSPSRGHSILRRIRSGPLRLALLPAAAALLLTAPAAMAADKEYKAWRLSCPATDAGRTCIVYTQTGGATAVGNVAVRVSIGRRNGSTNVLVVDVARPVVKERGFALGVDNNTPLIATIETCDQIACRAVVSGAPVDLLIEQFKKGRRAVVTYFAAPRTPVQAEILLDGFTAAYNSLRRPSG